MKQKIVEKIQDNFKVFDFFLHRPSSTGLKVVTMGPGPVPPGWLKCPRKSEGLIGGKFLAFKTPLSERFDEQVPAEYRFSPSMLFSSMKSYKQKIGLWIDLTKTDR